MRYPANRDDSEAQTPTPSQSKLDADSLMLQSATTFHNPSARRQLRHLSLLKARRVVVYDYDHCEGRIILRELVMATVRNLGTMVVI